MKKLYVENGQYERHGQILEINAKTEKGIKRRITQLKDEYAVYGYNWAGYLKAFVCVLPENWEDVYEWSNESQIKKGKILQRKNLNNSIYGGTPLTDDFCEA